MAFYSKSSLVPRYSVFEIQNAQQETDPIKLTVNLMLRLNKVIDAINTKPSGIYNLEQSAAVSTYPPTQTGLVSAASPIYWQTYFAGPLPNTGTLNIPHGITWTSSTTLITYSATATDSVNLFAIPIPYVDVSSVAVTGNIELYVDATNIVITTAGNASSYDRVRITMWWIQDV